MERVGHPFYGHPFRQSIECGAWISGPHPTIYPTGGLLSRQDSPMHMSDWLSLPDDRPPVKRKFRTPMGWRSCARQPGESFVYAIECDGFIKIGVSNNPEKRAAAIQGSSPHPVQVLKFWRVSRARRLDLERGIHELLRTRRVRNEWFNVTLAEATAAVNWALRVFLATDGKPDLARLIERPLTFINGELDDLSPLPTMEAAR